jgi:hypothetical protein
MISHLQHLLHAGLEVATPQLESGWLSIPMLAALMFGCAILVLPFLTVGGAFLVWVISTALRFKTALDDKATKVEAKAMVDGLRVERNELAKPFFDKLTKLEQELVAKANANEILPPLRALETKTNGQDVVLGGMQKDITHLGSGVARLESGNTEIRTMMAQVLARLPPLPTPHEPSKS